MIRAAILSCGPSLSLYDPSAHTADIRIGINRVAAMHLCDWWAALDLPLIREIRHAIKGAPSLFSRADYQARTDATATVENLSAWCPDIAAIAQYTCPAAIVFAGFLGAVKLRSTDATWG